MATLFDEDNLQPSLLDRLTDEHPERKSEPPAARMLTMQQLRESVRRDLGLLLNARRLEDTQDLSEYPFVRSSVVNLGLQDLAGLTRAELDLPTIEQSIRQAIVNFEPRLAESTVKVSVRSETNDTTLVGFIIEADLWAKPLPYKLLLQTDIDLESGTISINERDS